jgi:4-amino-4-deoxy-L-arabinose transferase-like glycosyltransferase
MSHRARGAAITILGLLALGALMFFPRVMSIGVSIGAVLVALIAFGVLDFFGAWKLTRATKDETGPQPFDLDGKPGWLRLIAAFDVRLLWLALALIAAAACRISVIGTLGAAYPWSGPVLIVLGLAVLGIARLVRRKRRFDGDFHEGFLVFALATATIMATLGSHGLWDCWETHYGEVARRQLERDDWISLFWEDKWFFSKPILIFWLMNLGMALFGVSVGPDHVSGHIEWGIRFFVAALAIAVICAVYQLLARRVSRRSGLFAALVLATMPLYAFMARQAVTDLPFVGLMALAVVLFLFGITADPQAEVRPIKVPILPGRRLQVSGYHAAIGAYLLAAVPQFVYFATRSARFEFGTLARGDLKTIASKLRLFDADLSDIFSSIFGVQLGGQVNIAFDWMLIGVVYLALFLALIWSLRHERRVSRLAFHGMYLCLALSVMAKGLPGLAMPILGLVGLWVGARPWRDIRQPRVMFRWHLDQLKRLDLLRGIPLFLLTASPWYLAMVLRHGDRFINRFFIHDHIKRVSVGVHGDTGTFQYFVEQFGYATFPWVILVPFALIWWYRASRGAVPSHTDDPQQRSAFVIRVFCASFTVLSFALLSLMVTKFHHYVFPLLPAIAILVGLFLDDIWQERHTRVGVLALVGVVILAIVARDLAADPHAGKGVLTGHAQLAGLFIYKYSRPYPGAEVDYTLPIITFAVLFGLCVAAWIPRGARRAGLLLAALVALAFSHWATQHYMIDLAPHWTQKHLIEHYYEQRKSPAERLVAFQMNWKGENLYTGNRVVVHVSTKNKNFEKWVGKHRGERHFFITEHHRFNKMSRRADAASGPLKELPDSCNKYKAGWADEL